MTTMLLYLVNNYSQPTGVVASPLVETPDTGRSCVVFDQFLRTSRHLLTPANPIMISTSAQRAYDMPIKQVINAFDCKLALASLFISQ